MPTGFIVTLDDYQLVSIVAALLHSDPEHAMSHIHECRKACLREGVRTPLGKVRYKESFVIECRKTPHVYSYDPAGGQSDITCCLCGQPEKHAIHGWTGD